MIADSFKAGLFFQPGMPLRAGDGRPAWAQGLSGLSERKA